MCSFHPPPCLSLIRCDDGFHTKAGCYARFVPLRALQSPLAEHPPLFMQKDGAALAENRLSQTTGMLFQNTRKMNYLCAPESEETLSMAIHLRPKFVGMMSGDLDKIKPVVQKLFQKKRRF